MVRLKELESYLSELLRVHDFSDYCPNGLQVEGRVEIRRLVTGVTASQALLDAAVIAGADAILVHHGYFWKGEDPCLVGMKWRRISTLFKFGLSLLAYHLPLDVHPQYGNNQGLGKALGLQVEGTVVAGGTPGLLVYGRLPQRMRAEDFAAHTAGVLGRVPLHVSVERPVIETIAWCSGAAQRFIDEAANLGVDAYLTGEVSEPTVHTAREREIHFFAAGHHATERYGVMSLGDHLAARFGIEHQFIDIDNPA